MLTQMKCEGVTVRPPERVAVNPSNAASANKTAELIGSDRVEGTAVFSPDGARMGAIKRVMIDKRGGNVAYAVMSFGGFLGIGEDYYPVPWQLLKYNEALGGYEVHVTDAQLKNAPKIVGDDWDDGNRSWSDYYSYYAKNGFPPL